MSATTPARWVVQILGFGQILRARADSPSSSDSSGSASSLDSYDPASGGSKTSWSLNSSGEPVIFVPVNKYYKSAENLVSRNDIQPVFVWADGQYYVGRFDDNGSLTRLENVEVTDTGTHIHTSVDPPAPQKSQPIQVERVIESRNGRVQKHSDIVTDTAKDLMEVDLKKIYIKINGLMVSYHWYRPREDYAFPKYDKGNEFSNLGPAYGTDNAHCLDCRKKTMLQWNQGTCLCPIVPKN